MTAYEKYNLYRKIILALIAGVTLYDLKITVFLSPLLMVFAVIYIKDWKEYKTSRFKTYEAYWYYTYYQHER